MMAWVLSPDRSDSKESVGSSSGIGFRGTRFSISKAGRLYLGDYGRNFTLHDDSTSYIAQIRHIMGPGWAGRLRIRYGGDTYCVANPGWIYVGKTNVFCHEHFPGYVLGAARNLPLSPPVPSLYSGPHNHGQVGERWTIPSRKFAREEGMLGNVGIKIEPGNWNWSTSKHPEFIDRMRSMFRLEDFIRFYITCYGYIVRPVSKKYWGDTYGIDIKHQFGVLAKEAPSSARSLQHRYDKTREDVDPNLYFVCGHVDDLMGGQLPAPDKYDPRTGDIDQDKGKWG
tara:strand:- start:252 stop:1100 length:849 start_codon:yes stop_codon:yes gene_type:complete